jgi:LacI family transcriptional regulator
VDHLSLSKPKLIAGIFGPSNIDTARRRRLGFVDACANLGIKNLIVEETNWNMRAGYEAGLKLLQRKNPPDGIFASTIMMGIGLLRAAYELNVPVPHSLQVVAMHDSDVANFLIPSLTTVHMPTIEMGSQSVDLLLRVIEGASVSHLIVDIDPYLVVRQSSTKA